MEQHLLQGWHADPFGLHEQRYFSAGRPTKLVRDGRVEAYEEPPSQQPVPEGATVTAGIPQAENDAAGAGLRESAASGAPRNSWSQVVRVELDGALGNPTAPYRGASARRRRTGLVNALVALVAAAGVVIFVAVEGGFSTKHGAKSHAGSAAQGSDFAAFVTASAKGTLAQKTADVSLTATTSINSSLVYLRGNGQVNLAANTALFNLSTSFSGTTFAETEITTGQALYIQESVNGQNMAQYLGGKHWVEIPLAGSATQNNSPEDSPAWSLQLLEQEGARVTAIGPRTVGGLACSGYAVTPSQQAMLAAAEQEWSQLGLSSSETAAARQLLENSTPPTIAVWLDPTKQLVCELDVAMQMGTGTSAGSGSAPSTESIQMVVTFTHYGVPVDITAPAQSDTVSF